MVNLHPALKEFDKKFNALTNQGYRHDASRVWDDFLSVTLSNFCLETPYPDLKNYIEKTYGEDVKLMGELFIEYLHSMQRAVTDDNSWFDLLGHYYEYLASRSKKQAFGQFFTPEHLCDLICQLTYEKGEEDDKIKTVNDPCCGSARFLISAHMHWKGKVMCYGEDLDPQCTKMAAINCLMHGVEAEIINHNSLLPDSFNDGYHVNVNLRYTGMPHIRRIKKEESHIINMWERAKVENKKGYDQQVEVMEQKYSERKEVFGSYQLTLFGE